MGPKAGGKRRGDARKVRQDKSREWVKNDRISISEDGKGWKKTEQMAWKLTHRHKKYSAKEQTEWIDESWEMKWGPRCREQRGERSKSRINWYRTIGHCTEQAWTADEVFTAAGSSLCSSDSASHTAFTQPSNTAEIHSHMNDNTSL